MTNRTEPQGAEQSFSPEIRRARIQIVDIYESKKECLQGSHRKMGNTIQVGV